MRILLVVSCFNLLLTGCEQQKSLVLPTAQVDPVIDRIVNYYDIHHPVIGRKGMVVSQSEVASKVGAEILRRGGNAVDAAVAVGFTLAVVLPRAGNLTGGGFMMVHLAEQNKTIAIDYREIAPQASFEHMFIDEKGEIDSNKSLKTLAASGVPGTVAGFEYALKHYGTMELSQLIQPAIEIAQQGFIVTDDMVRIVTRAQDMLKQNGETCRVFFKENCQFYQAGELFKQPDLAKTLTYLSEHGAKGFYQGDIAKKIVAAMEKGQGLITLEDLQNYQVNEVAPIKGSFNGYEIYTMPPPSSGGVHLVQMLNIFEQLPLADIAQGTADMMHFQTEIFKRSYADSTQYLGDPAFVDVPAMGITSKAYAKSLSEQISLDKITPSSMIAGGNPSVYESPDTTHFSIMDSKGNVVSNTYTLNHYFGNGITIPETGLLMNNTMDDFTAKAGSANSYGLVGGKANAIAANKRPISSMTPVIVLKAGQPFLATGTPGGSKIITAVFQQLVNVLWFDMNVLEAINAPRIHHQWQPDILYVERNVAADSVSLLLKKGYQIEISSSLGSLQSVLFKDGLYYGGADPRRPNAKAVAVD